MKDKSMRISAAVIALAVVVPNFATGAQARYFASSVTTTVGWSEWCAPGVVTVDLETGLYRWIQQLPRPHCGPEKAAPVVRGTLTIDKLKAIQDAARLARAQGLARVECAAGKPSERIVIGSGSGYLLTLVDPKGGIAAPGDLSCWSNAAFKLQRVLDHQFDVSPNLP